MRNLEASPYLEKPNLIEIKAIAGEKGQRLNDFTLSVGVTRQEAAEPSKAAAKPKQG
jgi:type IV pilus assembly protein PilN